MTACDPEAEPAYRDPLRIATDALLAISLLPDHDSDRCEDIADDAMHQIALLTEPIAGGVAMGEAVLTIGFAPGTPPGKIAEIIRAFETIHLELAGYPLRHHVQP